MRSISFFKNGLSAFELKVLACIFMLIDHIGVMLLPQVGALRVIGRLAYPLFAYFIAEGSRYTKNKLKRFLSVFVLGVLCQIVFVVFAGNGAGNILLTFSVSILLIYLLMYTKKMMIKSALIGSVYLVLFVLSLVAAYYCCELFSLDYGFFGALTPVLVVAFDDMGEWSDKLYRVIDRKSVSFIMLATGLLCIAMFDAMMKSQIYSLLSLILLALYNGERGKYSFKYGFYLFYPLHFLGLEAIRFAIEL